MVGRDYNIENGPILIFLRCILNSAFALRSTFIFYGPYGLSSLSTLLLSTFVDCVQMLNFHIIKTACVINKFNKTSYQ